MIGPNRVDPAAEPPLTRVYWLTEEFYPPQIGGVELMVSYLSHGLAGQGVPTQVITRQTAPPALAEELIGAVRVRRIRPGGQMKGIGWRALPAVLSYLWRLAVILVSEARSYDVVVVSGLKVIPLVAVPVCQLLGKRCIIRIESTFELAEPLSAESLLAMGPLGRLLHRSLRLVQGYTLRHAARVVAISREVELMLHGLGLAPASIATIPNGVDLERFRPASAGEKVALRRELSLPATATLVLFAGRLSRAKGIVRLVELWPRIIVRHPQLYLVVVGSGAGAFDDCEAELATFIRDHGLGGQAVMTGASDRVQDYLRAADLFVYPSLYEGFGLGTVEALACGVPAAVTPVGVAAELIEHGVNGFLFRPDDASGLLGAIDELVASRDRWPELGQCARAAAEPYALAAIIAQYVALVRAPR